MVWSRIAALLWWSMRYLVGSPAASFQDLEDVLPEKTKVFLNSVSGVLVGSSLALVSIQVPYVVVFKYFE